MQSQVLRVESQEGVCVRAVDPGSGSLVNETRVVDLSTTSVKHSLALPEIRLPRSTPQLPLRILCVNLIRSNKQGSKRIQVAEDEFYCHAQCNLMAEAIDIRSLFPRLLLLLFQAHRIYILFQHSCLNLNIYVCCPLKASLYGRYMFN